MDKYIHVYAGVSRVGRDSPSLMLGVVFSARGGVEIVYIILKTPSIHSKKLSCSAQSWHQTAVSWVILHKKVIDTNITR